MIFGEFHGYRFMDKEGKSLTRFHTDTIKLHIVN